MDEEYQGFLGSVLVHGDTFPAKRNPSFTESIDFVTMFGMECEDPSWLIEWLNQGLTMNINGQCTFIVYSRWRRHHKPTETYKDFLAKHALRKKTKNDEEYDNL